MWLLHSDLDVIYQKLLPRVAKELDMAEIDVHTLVATASLGRALEEKFVLVKVSPKRSCRVMDNGKYSSGHRTSRQ